MRRLLEPCWWILFLKITSSVLHYVVCFPAVTEGYVGSLQDDRHSSSAQIRRRKASGDPYWAYSGQSYEDAQKDTNCFGRTSEVTCLVGVIQKIKGGEENEKGIN
uniref:Uncharacterized protein n=1 Tax=Molossus molossus TaxID=27622 RepID=A0A7J8DD48_MOLMO|nr:hypothetical protein HJG59_015075 [Molossus molossus]